MKKLKMLIPIVCSLLFICMIDAKASAKYLWPIGSTSPTSGNIYDGTSIEAGVNCEYGCYDGHKGTDVKASYGTNVIAAESGVVVKVVNNCTSGDSSCGNTWGNHVKIKHEDGNYTLYAHLSSVSVSNNQSVSRGELIGKSGNTGNVSPMPTTSTSQAGSHLHFEVYSGCESVSCRVNPEAGYIDVSNIRPQSTSSGTKAPIIDPDANVNTWTIGLEDNFCMKTSAIWQIAGYVLYALKIFIPAIIIILGVIDFSKASIMNDDKALTKAAFTIIQRAIFGVVIFFIPTVVSLIIELISEAAGVMDRIEGCETCLLRSTSDDCEAQVSTAFCLRNPNDEKCKN